MHLSIFFYYFVLSAFNKNSVSKITNFATIMIDSILHLRTIENKDWATILFLVAFAIIAFTKSTYENRFADFSKLIYSDKYISTYRDSNNIATSFTLSLFLVHLLSFAFFTHICLSKFGFSKLHDWNQFIQIFTFITYFIISKFLIEKIIATAFNIEEIIEQFNFQKVIFRTYIGILLLPMNIILYYNNDFSKNFVIIVFFTVLISCLLTYFYSIKKFRKAIISKLFYFILYLCALEIGPYYFIYYCFTKGIA